MSADPDPTRTRSRAHRRQLSSRSLRHESSGARRLAPPVLRLGLGILIFATGMGKALDLDGFAAVIATYELGLPVQALAPLAFAVCAVELGLGLWLLSGLAVRAAAVAAALLNAGYFVLLGSALLRGLDIANCGCFGVFLARPLRWYSPLEELVLIAGCIALLLLQPDRRWAAGARAG